MNTFGLELIWHAVIIISLLITCIIFAGLAGHNAAKAAIEARNKEIEDRRPLEKSSYLYPLTTERLAKRRRKRK